jgi:hypothetical protein
MRGPGAALLSEAWCAGQVDASPVAKFSHWNEDDGTGYDSNKPRRSQYRATFIPTQAAASCPFPISRPLTAPTPALRMTFFVFTLASGGSMKINQTLAVDVHRRRLLRTPATRIEY